MANGTRTPTFLVVFALSIVGSWLIGCSRRDQEPAPQPTTVPTASPAPIADCPPAGNHLIEIGPKASDVSEKDAAISASKNHKVFWISQDDKKALTITFRSTSFPKEANGEPPFEGPNGKDQVIKCNAGGVCKAGRVNKNLQLPGCPKTLYYKYWQKLSDASGDDEADAGIIIER
jgi:hypothetical protein